MLHQKREEGKRNNGRRLVCTHCGGEVAVTLRPRHPHGHQAYAMCLDCGARNWEADQDKPWAYIRYAVEEREVN